MMAKVLALPLLCVGHLLAMLCCYTSMAQYRSDEHLLLLKNAVRKRVGYKIFLRSELRAGSWKRRSVAGCLYIYPRITELHVHELL